MYVLEIVVCPFVLFLLAIVLSVLRHTDSDYLPLVSSNILTFLCGNYDLITPSLYYTVIRGRRERVVVGFTTMPCNQCL